MCNIGGSDEGRTGVGIGNGGLKKRKMQPSAFGRPVGQAFETFAVWRCLRIALLVSYTHA